MRGNQGKFIPEDERLWIAHGRAILQEIIGASSMLPIAEDLGTVPPASRKCLKELGIPGTRVMRWERYWDEDKRFIPFDQYQPLSMTTLSTHDSETLDQWWKTQGKEVMDFADFIGFSNLPELTKEYRYQLLKKSHTTSSLFHINLINEYLALYPEFIWEHPEDERINQPGIVSDKNWSYRLKVPLETITKHAELKELMKGLTHPYLLI
jgi:4-alpha-glucanotransferase